MNYNVSLTLPPTFLPLKVKEDAVRVAAEAFMLPPAKNKAFVLTSGDEMVSPVLSQRSP